MPQYTLHSLLRWAHKAWVDEAPSLDHSHHEEYDESGAPEMKPAVAAYLGLQARKYLDERVSKPSGRPAFGIPAIARVGTTAAPPPPLGGDTLPDNWKALAGRKSEGAYVTPLRYAIELCTDPDERSFLRSLVPELYYPSEIAEIHGIPRWASRFVMYAALSRLRERYDSLMRNQEKGTAANVGWVSRSESQRQAEESAA